MSCCPCLDGKRDLFHQTIRKQQYQLPKLEETTAVSTYHNQYAGLLVNYGKKPFGFTCGLNVRKPWRDIFRLANLQFHPTDLQICSFHTFLICKFAVFTFFWFANLQFSYFPDLQICSFHIFLVWKFAVFAILWFCKFAVLLHFLGLQICIFQTVVFFEVLTQCMMQTMCTDRAVT